MRRGLLGAALLVSGSVAALLLISYWNAWQSTIAGYPASAFNIVLADSFYPLLAVSIILILTGLMLMCWSIRFFNDGESMGQFTTFKMRAVM